jgi:hypothetical protein
VQDGSNDEPPEKGEPSEKPDQPEGRRERPGSSHPPPAPVPGEQRKPSIRPPSLPPPSRPATGPVAGAARILFALGWLVLQGALVLTAERRADGAFGFRMFSESSTISVSLSREVGHPDGTRTRVHVDEGVWLARDGSGTTRRFSWFDRVRPGFAVFDQEVHARYGARAQLERLQAALDDVAAHTEGDTETKRLLLDVTIRRNGREPEVFHLASADRERGR